MSLEPQDFDEFFRAANSGRTPFRWQRRLLNYLLERGRWPEHISAPTGSGKSNVVDVHVFANALVGCGVAPRLPRRLAVVVNRRALVDNHHTRACAIRDSLKAEELRGVLAEVRDGLLHLQAPRTWAVGERPASDSSEEVLCVVELRGGIAPERGWVDDPTVCAVIAATPDMWGSRLLMRGYGSRSYTWPREAGLLAYDAVAVVDEAHLNRQLLTTAARIAQLEETAEESVDVPVLRVVDTTATPLERHPDTTVQVLATDLEPGADDALAERLTRPKRTRLSASPAWPGQGGKAVKAHIDHLVAEVSGLLEVRGGDARPVGCVVNRADTATRVADALASSGVQTRTWVGRLRPADIERLIDQHPGLFSSAGGGDATVDVLVATQTVEVGVDLDLFGLVTELASGSALAQRAGRVNRIGRGESADIVVVGPADPAKLVDYLPYRADDLRAAFDWVTRRSATTEGLAPWTIDGDPPPAESPRRLLYQRPEMYDAWWWSHTSEQLFAPSDLGLHLRDDLDPDIATAGLVFRDFDRIASMDNVPPDQSVLLSLLLATPPAPDETFDVTLWTLRQIVERALTEVRQQVFNVRDGDVTVLVDASSLRPGDVVILPRTFACLRAGVPVPEPATEFPASTFWGEPDVTLASDEWRAALAGLTAEDAQRAYDEGANGDQMQVVVPADSETADRLSWVVLKPRRIALADTEQLQASVLRGPVTLAQHQANVERRARDIAASVPLSSELTDVLAAAGRLHDEGKRDARFQRLLGAGAAAPEALAKSGRRSAQQARRDAAAAGLRSGWRHEQLSAAVVAAEDCRVADPGLVTRLVGTSHGRGRGTFDHPPSELSAHALGPAAAAAAEELFGPAGGWERLVESNQTRWGVWGCAYLEAVLRAVDCQVSREGS